MDAINMEDRHCNACGKYVSPETGYYGCCQNAEPSHIYCDKSCCDKIEPSETFCEGCWYSLDGGCIL